MMSDILYEQICGVICIVTSGLLYYHTDGMVKWYFIHVYLHYGLIQCAGLNMTSELVYNHIGHRVPY